MVSVILTYLRRRLWDRLNCFRSVRSLGPSHELSGSFRILEFRCLIFLSDIIIDFGFLTDLGLGEEDRSIYELVPRAHKSRMEFVAISIISKTDPLGLDDQVL